MLDLTGIELDQPTHKVVELIKDSVHAQLKQVGSTDVECGGDTGSGYADYTFRTTWNGIPALLDISLNWDKKSTHTVVELFSFIDEEIDDTPLFQELVILKVHN